MELLKPGTGLIFWQTVVFLGLVFLLARFAWKPILQALKAREDSIQDALDSAERAKQEMGKLKAENENLLKQAREERDRMLREAREMGIRLREEAQEEGRKRADQILEEARATIQNEKEGALKEVKVQVAMFSLQIAEKLIRKNISSEPAQRQLAEQFIKDLKMN